VKAVRQVMRQSRQNRPALPIGGINQGQPQGRHGRKLGLPVGEMVHRRGAATDRHNKPQRNRLADVVEPTGLLCGSCCAEDGEEYRNGRQHGAIDDAQNGSDVANLEQPLLPAIPLATAQLFRALLIVVRTTRRSGGYMQDVNLHTGIAGIAMRCTPAIAGQAQHSMVIIIGRASCRRSLRQHGMSSKELELEGALAMYVITVVVRYGGIDTATHCGDAMARMAMHVARRWHDGACARVVTD